MKLKIIFTFARRASVIVTLALVIWLLVASSQNAHPASAQTGGTYDLTWNSIDGGGAMFATGGPYSLGGTIGQADAGAMSGASYTLNGGFWFQLIGAIQQLSDNTVFMPFVKK